MPKANGNDGGDVYVSRKRGLINTVVSYENELQSYPNDSNEQLEKSNDAIYWKKKYESLKNESKAEHIELKESKKFVAGLEEYVTLLEEKVSQLENTITSKQSQSPTKSVTNVMSNNNESDKAALELQRKLLSFYEVMTCMKVEVNSNSSSNNNKNNNNNTNINSDEYVCTVRNKVRRIATRFILRTSNATNNHNNNTISINQKMDFVPKVNLNYLPEYLRAHVNFEASNAPVMMGDILQTLFNDDSSSEEAD